MEISRGNVEARVQLVQDSGFTPLAVVLNRPDSRHVIGFTHVDDIDEYVAQAKRNHALAPGLVYDAIHVQINGVPLLFTNSTEPSEIVLQLPLACSRSSLDSYLLLLKTKGFVPTGILFTGP